MRTIAATRYNILLQYRHGFYAVYGLVSLLYVGFLLSVGSRLRSFLTPIFIFSDPAMPGLYFIGGILLLEREDNTLQSVSVTPLRVGEYLLAKVISLSILAVGTALVLAVAGAVGVAGAGGLSVRWAILTIGVLLTSTLMTLVGIAIASRTDSIVRYVFAATPLMLVLSLPLLTLVPSIASPLFFIIPTHASLTLIVGAFEAGSISHGEIAASLVLLAGWHVPAWQWAARSFARYGLGIDRATGFASADNATEVTHV